MCQHNIGLVIIKTILEVIPHIQYCKQKKKIALYLSAVTGLIFSFSFLLYLPFFSFSCLHLLGQSHTSGCLLKPSPSLSCLLYKATARSSCTVFWVYLELHPLVVGSSFTPTFTIGHSCVQIEALDR